jgi:hypothetical protein
MGIYSRGKSIDVPIGDFAPDMAPTTQGILLDMDQAQPTLMGYQALLSAAPYISGPVAETPTGATVAFYSSGRYQIWVGGANHLYRSLGSVWTQADTGGALGATSRWRFAQFNDDLIAVANGVSPLVANGADGNFAALGGSPPANATVVLAVNGQVLMFAGANWYASALALDNNWTPNIQTQAGAGTLYDYPGNVVAAAPIFRNVVVFKQTATWLGTYVGGQAVWSFQLISDETGTWSQESVVQLPDGVAFIGNDDFYICSGYTPQRIPNSVKEWFFQTADPANLANILGRYDDYNAVIWWYFVSRQPTVARVPDRYVCYNVRAQRWGTGYLNTLCVPTPNSQPGLTTGLYFDTNKILQSYTGSPGLMRLKTAYYGSSGMLSQLMRVMPRYSIMPTSQSLAAFHANACGGVDTVGPTGVLGPDGWYYLRQYDRYHRVQLTAVGSSADYGAEVAALSYEFREGGSR